MALEGMDVDQAQQLARQLESYAQALTHLTSALGTLTGELSYHWQGPASAAFQQQWAVQYRGALGGAAQALAGMHSHLVANIHQQIQASAPDTGGGHPAGSAAGRAVPGLALTALLGPAWGFAQGLNRVATALTTPAHRILQVTGNAVVTGRYDKTWTWVMRHAGNSPFLKYKQSPMLQWLHANPHLQQASSLLRDVHAPVILEKAAPALGLLSLGVTAGQVGTEWAGGNYAGATADAAAAALKSCPNPALYLAGFDISLYKKDYELARQIQWNQIPNPFDPGVFQNDYVPTFKQLPGQLVSTLAEIM